jgi:uroporphyrinogen-III decarboxylase
MTPQEIYQHIQQIVRDAGPYGLILNCGGGIPPEMTLESLMHYFIAIEDLRRSSLPSS